MIIFQNGILVFSLLRTALKGICIIHMQIYSWPVLCQQSEQYEKPDDLSSKQEELLEHLIVDAAKSNT